MELKSVTRNIKIEQLQLLQFSLKEVYIGNTKKVKNIKFRCCKIVVRLSESIFGTKKKGFPEDSIYFVKLEERNQRLRLLHQNVNCSLIMPLHNLVNQPVIASEGTPSILI
jgi:hypothetical protein